MSKDDDDFDSPVTSRSDAEVEAIATACREAADATGPTQNVLALVKAAAEQFQVSRGLVIDVVEDHELPESEAEASLKPPTITIRRSVHQAAQRNAPRAVMTVSHELGHIVLEHKGHARPRRLREARRPTAFKAYEDAEHQAKVFAAAFLIPRSLVTEVMSVKEMQLRFGVSEAAARIRHEQIFGTKGKQTPTDVQAVIDAMKAKITAPDRRGATQRDAEAEAGVRRMWEDLEKIPGKDPAVFRKAGNFEVRWSDRYQPRSHYGWRVFQGQIRNYIDLETR